MARQSRARITATRQPSPRCHGWRAPLDAAPAGLRGSRGQGALLQASRAQRIHPGSDEARWEGRKRAGKRRERRGYEGCATGIPPACAHGIPAVYVISSFNMSIKKVLKKLLSNFELQTSEISKRTG